MLVVLQLELLALFVGGVSWCVGFSYVPVELQWLCSRMPDSRSRKPGHEYLLRPLGPPGA